MPAKTPPKEPREAREYPPLKAWLASEANLQTLKAILVNPVFLAAEHYAIAQVRVNPQDLVGPRPALDEVILRKAALQAGVEHAFNVLRALVIQHQTPQQLEPWGHILPPTQ